MTGPTFYLASTSQSRRAMLQDAGVPFQVTAAGVDEDAAKSALIGEGLAPRDLADALSELKALRASARLPDALVLGADQVLALDDGTIVSKCADREEAHALLRRLSDGRHHLHSGGVVAQAGRPVWRHVESVTMTVRPLGEDFIAAYLDLDWEQARWCVGCYRIEGPGAQLFSRIDGSLFAVRGLPLIPLLDFLRVRGVLRT